MILHYGKSFRKDCKILGKRRWNIEKLNTFVKKLPLTKNGHTLKGNFLGKRECHVSFDWIVIYETSGDGIRLLRTGTHSEILGD